MFSNKHLDLDPLRRCKIVLDSVLTEGEYKGKTFSELLDLDLNHATYLGDKVDNNWTWPVLQKWKKLCKIRDQKKEL